MKLTDICHAFLSVWTWIPSIWITPENPATFIFFCRAFTFTAAPWQLYLRSGRFDRTKFFPWRIWEFLPLARHGFLKSESASEKEPENLSLAASQKILPRKARCLILLDTEYSYEDCAALCSSFAQLPPKPNWSTRLRYSQPYSKALPLLPYLHLLLCTGSCIPHFSGLILPVLPFHWLCHEWRKISFMGKHRKVIKGLTPLVLLPSCNLGFSPR